MNFVKMIAVSALAGVAMMSSLHTPAFAAGETSQLTAEDAWARSRPASAKVGGAYVTLINNGKTDDRLIGAQSPVADRTELHTVEMQDGMMKMMEVKDGIPVPAGQTVALRPGGLHVMFMGLKETMEEGKTFPLTLTFEHAGDKQVTVQVRAAGAMKNMPHGSMNQGGSMNHGGSLNQDGTMGGGTMPHMGTDKGHMGQGEMQKQHSN
ncbi:copper chaperone PCu(A)C [Sneathiella chinensis]|uniref:Copper chaperone PCu(A)C n=1 Tax=Sneathiella chinensis TaxID=349750 RepID=A0ABQ5U7U8_9PROT|nr:copper chaperone PCu(A)C [Sneathiella chinensis]GLQ07979.1 hypothetical protein GCM10007924_32010 [Sneathiella chinensis]